MLEKSKRYDLTEAQIRFFNRSSKKEKIMNGRIKNVMTSKSFGFIYGEDGQEYFFHISGVVGSFSDFTPGKNVTFESVQSPKGKRAEDVRLV